MPKTKIGICLPIRNSVRGVWQEHFLKFLNANRDSYEFIFYCKIDPTIPIEKMRERILEQAVAEGICEYLLWLDDDVLLLDNALDELVGAGKGFISGIYWQKKFYKEGETPVLKKNEENGMNDYRFWEKESSPVFEVLSVGFGCFLMKLELVSFLIKPWFRPMGTDGTGEDIFFCEARCWGMVKENEREGKDSEPFKIYANGKVLCKHLKYSEGEYITLPDQSLLDTINASYN